MKIQIIDVFKMIYSLIRYVRASTLPAYLRLLTTMEHTSQFDIWATLLRLRVYVKPHDLLEFLFRRFVETWEIDYEEFEEELAEGSGEEGEDDCDQTDDDWEGEGVITGESLLGVISSSRSRYAAGGSAYLLQVSSLVHCYKVRLITSFLNIEQARPRN